MTNTLESKANSVYYLRRATIRMWRSRTKGNSRTILEKTLVVESNNSQVHDAAGTSHVINPGAVALGPFPFASSRYVLS